MTTRLAWKSSDFKLERHLDWVMHELIAGAQLQIMLDRLPLDVASQICGLLSSTDRRVVTYVSIAWAQAAYRDWKCLQCTVADTKLLCGIARDDPKALKSLQVSACPFCPQFHQTTGTQTTQTFLVSVSPHVLMQQTIRMWYAWITSDAFSSWNRFRPENETLQLIADQVISGALQKAFLFFLRGRHATLQWILDMLVHDFNTLHSSTLLTVSLLSYLSIVDAVLCVYSWFVNVLLHWYAWCAHAENLFLPHFTNLEQLHLWNPESNELFSFFPSNIQSLSGLRRLKEMVRHCVWSLEIEILDVIAGQVISSPAVSVACVIYTLFFWLCSR